MTVTQKLEQPGVRRRVRPGARGWNDSPDLKILTVILLLTAAVFWPVLTARFTSWDDHSNVAGNIRLNPVRTEMMAKFWTHAYQELYIPLTYTVWGGIALLARRDRPDDGGLMLDAWPFHLANLFMHGVAIVAVYLLLYRMTKNRLASGAGALFFAIHPLQVEPVAWVTGMKDLLCGALSLLALWQYLIFAEAKKENAPAARARKPLIWAWALYALAVLAKPSGVIIPLAAIVLDRWIAGRTWKQIFASVWPMFLLAAGWAILTSRVQSVTNPADGGRVLLRPLIAADALAFYLYKLGFPLHLSMQYDRAPGVVIANGWLFYTWLAPAAVGAVILLFSRKSKGVLAAGGLFVAGLLPVLGLIPFGFQGLSTVADRYAYVSMLGPALVVAMLIRWTLDPQNSPIVRRATQAAFVVCVGLLAIRSFFQTAVWHDTQSLFTHALAVNPRSYAAAGGLAADLVHKKQFDEGAALAERAIELRPDRPEAYVTLAVVLNNRGQQQAAIDRLQTALTVSPRRIAALTAMGNALAQQKKMPEAEALFRKAIDIDPEACAARRSLTVLLAATGRVREALQEAKDATDLDPDNAEGQTTYAMLLAQTGERDAALARVSAVLKLQPDNEQARMVYDRLTGGGQ